MGCANWRPHGLVLEPGMESLYLNAQVTIDANGNPINPNASFTVNLFEFLFHRHLFTGGLMCFSQQPLDDRSDQSCDLVAQDLENDGPWQIACFATAKEDNDETSDHVLALETQALEYCKAFLLARPAIDRTFACTMVGASIRCWVYRRGDEHLTGF